MRRFALLGLLLPLAVPGYCAAPPVKPEAGVRLLRFLPEQPLGRVGRPTPLTAEIENRTAAPVAVRGRLTLPPGLTLAQGQSEATCRIAPGAAGILRWEVTAANVGPVEVELRLEGAAAAQARAGLNFLPALALRHDSYLPPPVPAPTSLLIGAHHCPLWEADKPNMWANLTKHPERTPALGFYAQENPEISDWETKWAVEHGISFFIYCWYRAAQGGAVKTRYGSAIHDALFQSRFVNHMKFTIMWENQHRGVAGVADQKDLFENLLPYWIKNYFQHPSYLKVDNRPLLFIYRPEFLVQDLGSEANVARAFGGMREACRAAGFAGLYLLGEYRGTERKHLELMRRLGLDYTFAYCWHVAKNPTPTQAIDAQMQSLRKTQELGVLPQVATVSQAWSGWRDEGSIWKIPPADYDTLLRRARDFVTQLPKDELGSRMLLLDNWNEWGEGHYIAPYREYGFGYLDAVRNVFSSAPAVHEDLLPQDLGRGPYDSAYWTQIRRAEAERRAAGR